MHVPPGGINQRRTCGGDPGPRSRRPDDRLPGARPVRRLRQADPLPRSPPALPSRNRTGGAAPGQRPPSSLALLLAATVAAVSRSGLPRRAHFCLLHRSETGPAAAGPRSKTASSPYAPNSPARHRRRGLSAQLGLTKGIAPVLPMPSTERPDPGAIAAGADRPRRHTGGYLRTAVDEAQLLSVIGSQARRAARSPIPWREARVGRAVIGAFNGTTGRCLIGEAVRKASCRGAPGGAPGSAAGDARGPGPRPAASRAGAQRQGIHPVFTPRSQLVFAGAARRAIGEQRRRPGVPGHEERRNLRAGVVAEKVRAGGLGPLTSCT